MYIKTINYTDYNGNARTEDHYFNLTEAEALEMEMSTNGGFSERIKRIIAAQDTATLITIFKDLIKKSYGRRSLEGRKCEKAEEMFNEFKDTEAYSILFMELATDAKAATEFVNGIAPKKKSDAPAPVAGNVVPMN